ncbi:MAG: alpha-glucan family phosphorylase [Synergistes sp.]|nr:alpha-glucan family phosphorylase [Synergistes sp.]
MINIALHGHFYQPPREDPITGIVPADESAAPAHDWNERVASECYMPNARAKILAPDGRIAAEKNNYELLSFDFGPTLHKWIEKTSPLLNSAITKNGHRALAQAYSHMILPLAAERDRKTQILWGIRDFEYRFGRRPKGMWLPECAADSGTLEEMAACGLTFTILSPFQCAAVITEDGTVETKDGSFDVTRPYRCELPSGRSITVFFYHAGIAQGIAFGGLLENGDSFAEALLREARDNDDRILLAATDGESYGHHHKFGEMALARCFMDLEKDGRVCLPALEEFLEKHPPAARCVIKENSSWSCAHGIERWRSDCGCHTGGEEGWNQKWRAPLREAFDRLAEKLDRLFEEKLAGYCDPWQLRDEAIEIYKSGTIRAHNEIEAEKLAFLAERIEGGDEDVYKAAADLLEMQRMKMFMYTSCAWFFNDISGVETKHSIACALRAAQIAEELSGNDYTLPLTEDLKEARGNTAECPDAAAAARSIIMKHPEMENQYSEKLAEQNNSRLEKIKKMNNNINLANAISLTLERDPAFRNVAYFSMEIALKPEIPTYSGGLGVLAGDILKSAADLGVPMVGVTLLYRRGYFAQKINKEGRQTESPVKWNPGEHLTQLPNKVSMTMNGRNVTVGVWCYMCTGASGCTLPIYFIDTDLPENCEEDRDITADLYGGDNRRRLCQELVLGIGGLRILRDLGYRNISTFHLNEGHAGFLTLELLREQGYNDIEKIRNQVIFTTHTPVAAGHDFFSYELIKEVMDSYVTRVLQKHVGGSGLSMTDLALKFSHYVNGVSRKHAYVSREMFSDDSIDWITNGVHSATWTCPSFAKLYDEHIPGWGNDPSRLMQALRLPEDEVWKAHQAAKMRLLAFVLEETGRQLDPDILTIGFARRAATYKRADLVFSDLKRLVDIARGKVQFIFSGKAHPHDEPGKDILQKINCISKELGEELPVVFIENYNMGPAKFIVSGVDLWLNTPIRPREASGTSGMKCVHNGVINFSVLDGWWIEGCIEGITGWGIGPDSAENKLAEYNDEEDAADLYDKLEHKIIPLYYNDRSRWIKMMRAAIAVNASYFNTHRVVREYCEKAYGTKFRGH